MKKSSDRYYVGMDLHSNNVMIGIINQEGQRIKDKKLDCDLDKIDQYLRPYKSQIQGVVVESTFNWYWLVDGLMERSYPVELANPAQIEQYSGLKHGNDKSDAYFLAELKRLNILPTGYIYDSVLRPVRDLLRRRMSLVHQRTALILSFKSLYARTTGQTLALSRVKTMSVDEAKKLYEHPANCYIAKVQKEHIGGLDQSIKEIEKVVLLSAQEIPCYTKLTTIPGIGKILAMTITMEIGDISRFKKPGHFASYCRTVDARHLSNGKKKANNNAKCGNRYLSWAFVEAANFAKRSSTDCRQWFDRKAAKSCSVLATKALACKLAKAAWYIVTQNTPYDARRVFPEKASATQS
ncbi:MAG: IS110 family transposase [Nitrospira sp.]|nr:IS110 family transposase [Nitrospira sp.]